MLLEKITVGGFCHNSIEMMVALLRELTGKNWTDSLNNSREEPTDLMRGWMWREKERDNSSLTQALLSRVTRWMNMAFLKTGSLWESRLWEGNQASAILPLKNNEKEMPYRGLDLGMWT